MLTAYLACKVIKSYNDKNTNYAIIWHEKRLWLSQKIISAVEGTHALQADWRIDLEVGSNK